MIEGIAIELELAGGVWTDYGARLESTVDMQIESGFAGEDRLAQIGVTTWAFVNFDDIFTVGHADQLGGWEVGMRVRVKVKAGGTERVVFFGFLSVVDPHYDERVVYCAAVDGLAAIRQGVANVGQFATNVKAKAVLQALLVQAYRSPRHDGDWQVGHPTFGDVPVRVGNRYADDWDAGRSTFAWVGDRWAEDQMPLVQVVQDVLNSDLGYLFVQRDGAVRFVDRVGWGVDQTVDFVFDESEIGKASRAVRDEERLANYVRTVVYPREATADTVTLYELPAGEFIGLPPDNFMERTVKIGFVDPSGVAARVVAWSVDQPKNTIDYETDPAGYAKRLGVWVEARGDHALVHIRREPRVRASRLSFFRLMGKALLSYAPVMYDAVDGESVAVRGRRSLTVDMPLQNSQDFGVQAAQYILSERLVSEAGVELVVDGDNSDAAGVYALSCDVGDRVTVTERRLGLDGVDLRVWHRRLIIGVDRRKAVAVLGCRRAAEQVVWIVGVSRVGIDNRVAL